MPQPLHTSCCMPHTEKMVRKQLEEELGMELSSKKALIRQEVRQLGPGGWYEPPSALNESPHSSQASLVLAVSCVKNSNPNRSLCSV